MDFTRSYIAEASAVLLRLEPAQIGSVATGLAVCRNGGGRLFVLGMGGSAATASHAANDFRKLCDFEAYAPTDNVAELTARANDDGFGACLTGWLKASRCGRRDALLVLSVGGGDVERGISVPLVLAVQHAACAAARVYGIVGRDGGYVGQMADACVIVPAMYPDRITPHTEGTASVVLHLLASHPALAVHKGKWETEGAKHGAVH